MKNAGISDPYDIEKVRKLGVIDLPTIQKKANLHFSLTLDLFGNEISTNAANAFHAGLKGRYREDRLKDDHQLESGTYPVLRFIDGKIQAEDTPALSALNMRLRDDYVVDCNVGVARWNKVIEGFGIPFQIKLPHVAFHRHIGEFSRTTADVNGKILSPAEWTAQADRLPAVVGRQGLHRKPDAAGIRAGQIRQLDLAAQGRHRQQAGRFRIRENRLARRIPSR